MLFKSQNSAMTKKLEHSFSRFSVSCISVSLPFVSVLSGSVDEDLLFLALPLGLADHISIGRSVVTSITGDFLLPLPFFFLNDEICLLLKFLHPDQFLDILTNNILVLHHFIKLPGDEINRGSINIFQFSFIF